MAQVVYDHRPAKLKMRALWLDYIMKLKGSRHAICNAGGWIDGAETDEANEAANG